MSVTRRLGAALIVIGLAVGGSASAQEATEMIPAPERADQGDGPFERLIIRGVIVIDGAGAPPQGPIDLVIEGNRIAEVRGVGAPGALIDDTRRPQTATREIDAQGMYVMPGFVDLHTHIGGVPKAPEAEYTFKLWMGHGVTTVRDAGGGARDWVLRERDRSERNEIVAPRIVAYGRPGTGEGWEGGSIRSAETAREWVRWAAAKGVEGLKLGAYDPSIMEALIDEAKQLGMGTMAHLGQNGVGRMNAIDAARLGLGTVTHYYGLFESLLKDYTVQNWPPSQNQSNEQDRFGQVARLWNQIHPRGSDEWQALIHEFIELGTTLDPTMTIYEAGRDVMRARNADWHAEYTLPAQWEFFEPSRVSHGAYWYYWTTHDEVAWKNFYKVWMSFLNDFKNQGGRVTTGSDSGFIYKLYGFGYIREFELLQEAGFHPLEVIRSATLNGAETLHEPKGTSVEYGLIRPGLLADLVVVDENPLENFQVLYGTGAQRLNDETGLTERVGGVRYTIKDGIVYDAKELLADVRRMVERAKRQQGDRTTTAGSH
ncbi:MAG: amidohydrolase [Acidobacteria bacterium]|nr:amidohydrolase [Acidobacteriota bacterium]MBF86014.1 amidohydrolase [Acidobacteriota bacterium]MEC7769014.1 amidohydrolase family protein [Acidobacteriota bacterium]|tara:strand:+ start:5597 stop:7222 length:1626 start_codon:yes stop_codon:yes gene_type:complete